MANAVLQIGLALEDSPAGIAQDIEDISHSRELVLRYLARQIDKVGGQRHKLSVRVDSSTAGSTQFPLSRASLTNTIVQASLVADTDTLTFGTLVTLTWVAEASSAAEVTIGATDADCATNLAAKINASPYLAGLVSASAADDVVTLSWLSDPRAGVLVGVTETGSGQTLSTSVFLLDTTEANAGTSYLFSDGGIAE
jgi:hypothetical protein